MQRGVFGLHPREQLSLFGSALQKKGVQELVLAGVVGMQKPEHLAEVVGKVASPLSVSVAHQGELTRGFPERPFERIVHREHVAGIGQHRSSPDIGFPPPAPNSDPPEICKVPPRRRTCTGCRIFQ